ncbi:MAG: hypothetical protein WAN48_11005 [Actinomycetes bacterium]
MFGVTEFAILLVIYPVLSIAAGAFLAVRLNRRASQELPPS